MGKSEKNRTHPSQAEKFIESARALGCDEDPAHFDEALKKVARHKPAKDGGNANLPPIVPEPHKEGK